MSVERVVGGGLAAEVGEGPARKGRVPGEAGVWVFIFGDLAVFTLIFSVFLHARGVDPGLFDSSQASLHRIFGGVNTLLLLTSSLLVVFAVNAIRGGGAGRVARWTLGVSLGCAGLFLMNKGIEWGTLLSEGHGPNANPYYMYFFVFTGLHAAHVVLGAVVLFVLIRLSQKEALSGNQLALVESGGCFWHLVDVLWLIIFPLLYLMH